MTNTPIIHALGEGEANCAFHLDRNFRITPRDTEGAFCVFEELIDEGTGPPLHIHHTELELFTVLSGSLIFHCDGVEAVAKAGATVLIPKGSRHAFKGLGPGASRILVMLSPGGGEGFFREVATLSLDADIDAVHEIAKRYNVEFVGPPLE